MGIEPMTSCLLDRRSNQLSYGALLGNTGQFHFSLDSVNLLYLSITEDYKIIILRVARKFD